VIPCDPAVVGQRGGIHQIYRAIAQQGNGADIGRRSAVARTLRGVLEALAYLGVAVYERDCLGGDAQPEAAITTGLLEAACILVIEAGERLGIGPSRTIRVVE